MILCHSLLRNLQLFFKKFFMLKTMDLNYSELKVVTVAVCQMTSTNDKAKNLNVVTDLVEKARNLKANMVFIPEACDFISASKSETLQLAETLNGNLMNTYKNLATKNEIWISIGGFHELPLHHKEPTKTYNTHCIINDKGVLVSTYRKLHLFDVSIPEQNMNLIESERTLPGANICEPVDTPIGKVGLGICYDVRFPEFSTILRKLGANILVYPSAFTHFTGEAHWEILLRSRAIENQCYVIAAAQAGRHNESRISHGHAMIIDPWGKIVTELPKYNENYEIESLVASANINKDIIDSTRKKMPVFEHRRINCYNLTSDTSLRQAFVSGNCITDKPFMFADISISRKIVFYESIHSIAFTNLRCVVPGHVLIVSKRKVQKLEELIQEEQADLFQTTIKVEKLVEKVHKTKSSTIICQDGVEAGQTVPHVHIHVLPRLLKDFRRNYEIYHALAKHDQGESQLPKRKMEEMIAEAVKLREITNNM